MPVIASPIKLVLISDLVALDYALRHAIMRSAPHLRISAQLNDLRAAREYLRLNPAPDLLVLDLQTAQHDCIPWLRQHANSLCSTLLFTREDNEKLQDQAILAGARGHISHRASMDEFLHAIDRVHAGDVWLSQQASGRLLKQLFKQNTQLSGRQENELSPHPPSTADLEQQDVQYASTAQYLQQLTPREQRILCALLNAPEAPAKTIAVLLNISESTLRNHLTRIYEKLGVKNRNGLFSLSLHGGFPFLPNSSRMN